VKLIELFRNMQRECLKDKINELETNSKNKSIRDLYRGVNNLRRVTNLEVKVENGDDACKSHSILT
jgi:hypothetical protein